MELLVWNGESDWGVPSMDLECLKMMTYAKFSGAPVTVHKSCDPLRNSLPLFTCSQTKLKCFDDFATFLRRNNYGCDYELSSEDCADTLAYEYMLENKLKPVLTYIWWIDLDGYHKTIHKWYFSHVPFPQNFWYANRRRKYYLNSGMPYLEDLVGSDNVDDIETQLHKDAQECLTLLSNKLGEKEFFFGNSPTQIDAVLFAYLNLLLKVEVKQATLRNHIKACPNLENFVNRISKKYFPNGNKVFYNVEENSKTVHFNRYLPPEFILVSYKGYVQAKKAAESQQDFDVENKGRNLIISSLTAATAMLAYALSSGIVQIDMSRINSGEGSDFFITDDDDNVTNEE